LEENCCGVIEVLSLYLLGGTEENEDKTSVRTALG
jgi:hypothetical protein